LPDGGGKIDRRSQACSRAGKRAAGNGARRNASRCETDNSCSRACGNHGTSGDCKYVLRQKLVVAVRAR
jgi:hypothetical protein